MRKDEKRILKISIVSFLLFELFVTILLIFLHYKKYHYVAKGDVIAEVNGEKIYSKEIESRLEFLSDVFGNKNLKLEDFSEDIIKALLLEQYIDKRIIEYSKDKKIYIDIDSRFKAKEYYKNLIREKYLDSFVFNSINDYNLKRKYEELTKIAEGKEERKISHILVETEDEANRIRNTILRLNNFESMAKRRSLDTATAINGGSLGYVVKEELVYPEFSNVAFLLKVNELSKPVQTKEGWHIIKVNDIRDIKLKTFEESKDSIYNELKKEVFNEFVNSVINIEDVEKNIKVFIKTNNSNDALDTDEDKKEQNDDYDVDNYDKNDNLDRDIIQKITGDYE